MKNSHELPFSFSFNEHISAAFHAIAAFFTEHRYPILAALGLRVFASLWLAIVWFILDPYFPRTDFAIRETYNHLKMHDSLIARALIDVWLRWDAVHYMNLAWGGYENAGAADMNFWPLYPYLVRIVQYGLGGETVLAGLLISTVSTIIAAVFVWKLVSHQLQDRTLANQAVFIWVIFPTSFFLVAPYTDALFAALAAACIWNISQRKWITAGILGALASLTRSQGVLLLVPYVLVFGQDWLSNSRLKISRAIMGFVMLPLGTLAFLFWRWTRDVPDLATSYSQYSKALILDPISSFFMANKRLLTQPDLLGFTELLSVIFFLGVLVWMLTQPVFRKNSYFIIYGILTIVFILIKHNLSATPLQSSNRYILNTLPAFVGIAHLVRLAVPPVQRLIFTFSISLALIVSCLYALWVFVG